MMKKIFASIIVVLFAASPAFAADDRFSKMDKNRDGKINKQEYLDAVGQTFNKLDKNRDGRLTRDELLHIDKKDLERYVKETDKDNDGIIIKKEFEQAAEKRFFQADKNKNGYIDKMEWPSDRSELYSPFKFFTF